MMGRFTVFRLFLFETVAVDDVIIFGAIFFSGTGVGMLCCCSFGAILTYEESFLFFLGFSTVGGFGGDFCLTDSAFGKCAGDSLSLSFPPDFGKSYEENPKEMDFFESNGLGLAES